MRYVVVTGHYLCSHSEWVSRPPEKIIQAVKKYPNLSWHPQTLLTRTFSHLLHTANYWSTHTADISSCRQKRTNKKSFLFCILIWKLPALNWCFNLFEQSKNAHVHTEPHDQLYMCVFICRLEHRKAFPCPCQAGQDLETGNMRQETVKWSSFVIKENTFSSELLFILQSNIVYF